MQRTSVWAVYLLSLCVLASALSFGLRVLEPEVSSVQVKLVNLDSANKLVAGETEPITVEFHFDRPGDYLIRLELCAAACEILRWGIPVGDATVWKGPVASVDREPGRYEAILRVFERFETVFFRTVFEHRWDVVVHEPYCTAASGQ